MKYYEYGLVRSLTLKQTQPPFLNTLKTLKKSTDKSLPAQLRPYLSKHLRRLQLEAIQDKNDLFYHIFPIERIRLHQRIKAKHQKSVILFACQSDNPESLQNTLMPYICCAEAIHYTTDSYRIIICNDIATKETLLEEAKTQNKKIDIDKITCRSNIHHIDQIKDILTSLEEDEFISLLYISSHGQPEGLDGNWGGPDQGPSILSDTELKIMATLFKTKKSEDAQIYLNSCYSFRHVAPFLRDEIPGTIIMGANNPIPTGKIFHNFAVDAFTGRLYATFNCLVPDECEIFADTIEILDIEDSDSDVESKHPDMSQEDVIDLTSDFMKNVHLRF